MASTRLHLYLKHREALIDQATRIVGDHARAEDVVQDAWERFSASAEYDTDNQPIARPVAYLRRIVLNLAIDFSRRQQVENVHPDGDADLYHMPANEASPEQAAIDRDQLDHVTAALDALRRFNSPRPSRCHIPSAGSAGLEMAHVGSAFGAPRRLRVSSHYDRGAGRRPDQAEHGGMAQIS